MSFFTIEVSDDIRSIDDSFQKKLPFSLLYTSESYLRLLTDYLHAEIQIIKATDKNGDALGIFPLMFKQSNLGIVCNSLPFYGSNGGPQISYRLDSNEYNTLWKEMIDTADRMVQERNCLASTYITNPLDPRSNEAFSQFYKYDFIDSRIGQITVLPDDSQTVENDLLSMFEDPRPRNIRKALKENISVVHSNAKEDLDFLYEVHKENITAINGIPKEREFFENVYRHFDQENYCVYVAMKDGVRIAALLLFYFNQTVEYFTPAVMEGFRNLQPATLIIYQAMLDGIRKGYKNWNWGGTWLTQTGVYDFKKKWGTKDFEYKYYVRVYDASITNMTKENLLSAFANFYVVPFSTLSNAK